SAGTSLSSSLDAQRLADASREGGAVPSATEPSPAGRKAGRDALVPRHVLPPLRVQIGAAKCAARGKRSHSLTALGAIAGMHTQKMPDIDLRPLNRMCVLPKMFPRRPLD